jgi:hypothetical protein
MNIDDTRNMNIYDLRLEDFVMYRHISQLPHHRSTISMHLDIATSHLEIATYLEIAKS